MLKYFCNCGKRILKKEMPWCEMCRLKRYQRSVKKTKQGKHMWKLQDENAPEADAPKEGEEETKEETTEETEEETTEPENKEA